MAKHDRTVSALRKRPIPSNIRWDDVVSLLKSLGFELVKGSGSRRKFFNKDKNVLIICHEPHPQSYIDKGCASDIHEKLKENELI